MKNLYIMGTPGSGKTLMALGLALKFKQEGYRVAYFKPVGTPARENNYADTDAVLMKEVLAMSASVEEIVPSRAGMSYLSANRKQERMGDITSAYQKVSVGADLVIIDGAVFPYVMTSWGLDDVALAMRMNAVALITVKIEDDYSLDRAIFYNEFISLKGLPLAGNVFNNVPRPVLSKVEGVYVPLLEEKGYRSLGVIPRLEAIAAPTVEEFYHELGGDVLAGHNKMNLQVQDIVIGAMTTESALKFLRRATDKAVILGGDRGDLALAALETGTSVLILTGGLYPDVRVLARAEEKNVPVILVHYDTYTVVEKLHMVTHKLKPEDQEGKRLALENIENYCNYSVILDALQE
jgi:BioD-like phosphotransacetylase family protein